MTIGQLTALAICVLGLGIYSTAKGLITHIKLRKALQNRKKLNLPKERAINVLMLVTWTGAIYLEDQILHKHNLPIPELFLKVGSAFNVALVLATILFIHNHFRKASIKRDDRMLFIETGFLIIVPYLILSPAIMAIYLRVTAS